MSRKINPQTRTVKDASVEETILDNEPKALNDELQEKARELAKTGKSLVVNPVDTPKTYLSVADELSEQWLNGNESAMGQLAAMTEQAKAGTEQEIAQFVEHEAGDQGKIVSAGSPGEREKAWMESQTMGAEKRQSMQMVMRTFSQLQQMRIGIGNQIFAVGRKIILGLDPSQSARELKSVEAKKIMLEMEADYNKVSEGMVTRMLRNQDRFQDSRLDQFSYVLIGLYLLVKSEEDALTERINALCANFEVYEQFLRLVPGIGPLSSGKIIALLDPNRATYSSSFVKYCGLDVVMVVNEETGEISYQGRSKRKAHLEQRTYIDKDGKEQTKLSITFNPEAKCALYNIANSLIKMKSRIDRDKVLDSWKPYKVPVYADVYDAYKHRKAVENEIKKLGRTKTHLNAMAKRYLERIFLQELHPVWCHILGMNEKVRLPWHLEHHDEIQRPNNFRYEPVFAPLKDIVKTHAVRGRAQIDELVRQGIF